MGRMAKSDSRQDEISRFMGRGKASIPVKIRGDVWVCVPDSLEIMTSYVLLEQEDWFEDEIRFVRRLLEPGKNAIDIGANYGVYTLSMAKTVAAGGKVWAFEPARETARFLSESVVLNKFGHVQVVNAALSDFDGDGTLGVERNSECNRLLRHAESDAAQEAVRVCTLDSCESVYRWSRIDFVKLDAEGEECNIIAGGKHFFASNSPLLLVEFKHGQTYNFPLIPAFEKIGYAPYRLLPGLHILVPFEAGEAIDPFQLNLFFCKPDQAQALEKRGFLVTGQNPAIPECRGGWQDLLGKLPYGKRLIEGWLERSPGGYEAALDCYVFARQESQPPAIRYAALRKALASLVDLSRATPSVPRLMSLARVYADMGLRSNALNILAQLRGMGSNLSSSCKDEPFLAVSARFDGIDPRNELGHWVLASVLDQWEMLSHFSSYFTGVVSLGNLEAIKQLGFCKPDMEKRIQLLRKRLPPKAEARASPPAGRPGNLPH